MAFQLLVFSKQDLTSNCHETDKFEFEIIVPTTRNTKTTNYPRSLPQRFTLISDSESKFKNYARLGNYADRDIVPLSYGVTALDPVLD